MSEKSCEVSVIAQQMLNLSGELLRIAGDLGQHDDERTALLDECEDMPITEWIHFYGFHGPDVPGPDGTPVEADSDGDQFWHYGIPQKLFMEGTDIRIFLSPDCEPGVIVRLMGKLASLVSAHYSIEERVEGGEPEEQIHSKGRSES